MNEEQQFWLGSLVILFIAACYWYDWEEPLSSLELRAAEALYGTSFPNHWLITCVPIDRYTFFHPRFVTWAREYKHAEAVSYKGYLKLVVDQQTLNPVRK